MDALSLRDRVFLYGDGLFETIVVTQGHPVWLDLHLERLSLGAERLRIVFDQQQLRNFVDQQIASISAPHSVLRLTLSRGVSERGYLPPREMSANFFASCNELPQSPAHIAPPMTLATSTVALAEQPALAGIKHCNRLEQVLGALDARDQGVDEVLMATEDGLIQCTSRHNVFVVCGDRILTPPCERSGILGTRRRVLLEILAPAMGVTVSVQPIHKDELNEIDGVFVTNAIDGIRAVSHLNDRALQTPDIVVSLQGAYLNAMAES